ncbi:nuclear transport factor 2 family protein [Dongia sp.]|uniref:nuclear transport factor 2 family protein n=1 Tax=Dongia sp. TaxID=1977262 RepID=UPI0035B20CFE
MDPRYQEIVAALEIYFDGLYHSDTKRLARVFHPQAIYACATEGTLTYHTMASYFPVVDARPAPAGRNEIRADRIVSIQFAGPVTAIATVNCAIGPKAFTDLLTFVKLDGRWQIMAKVFHFDLTPEAA